MSARSLLAVLLLGGSVLAATLLSAPSHADEDPLPSWKGGAAKQAILDFVESVTRTTASPPSAC